MTMEPGNGPPQPHPAALAPIVLRTPVPRQADERPKILRAGESAGFAWHGDGVRLLLAGAECGNLLSIQSGQVPPQGGPPPHRHVFEEGFYVSFGALQFIAGSETYTARGGDYVHLAGNVAHDLRNLSAEPAEVVLTCAPAGFELFQKAVAEMGLRPGPDASPQERETLVHLGKTYGIDLAPPPEAFQSPPQPGQAKHLPAGEGETLGVVGDVYRFLVRGRETGGKYALWEALVPPGGGPPLHLHTREYEAFYILAGEMTFTIEGNEQRCTAGDTVFSPPHVRHAFRNASQSDARMLIWVAPAGAEEMFFETGVPLPAGARTAPPISRDEIARLLQSAPKYGIVIFPPDHAPH